MDAAYVETNLRLQGFNQAMIERLTDEFLNEIQRQRTLHANNPIAYVDSDAWLKPHWLWGDGSDVVVDVKKWDAMSAKGSFPQMMMPPRPQ